MEATDRDIEVDIFQARREPVTKDWLADNAPLVLLGVALLAAAVLLLALTWGLTFFQDTWEFLMNRRAFTADALLTPHNEHIVVIPVAIQQLLLRLFGMTSAMPEYVVMIAALLVTATLLFVYMRRRLGPWPALMAAALLLFLGPAWEDILWPFEIGFVSAMLFGIVMLLAFDRDDRVGDLAACLALSIAIGFSSLGVAFLAGAAVDIFQRRHRRGLSRVWVAGVPLVLYAAWWLGWGHQAESHLSLHNVLVSPLYVLEGFAVSLEDLLGLSKISVEAPAPLEWGPPILVALVALLVYRQLRKPGFHLRLWPVAASAAAYWLLAAFNYIPGREAYQSKYIYPGAVFVLLLAADLMRGMRFGRKALLIGGVAVVAAIASNLTHLNEGSRWLKQQTVLTRADLAAIEIAQRTINGSFWLNPENTGTSSLIDVKAGEYLSAAREYGSPAYTVSELEKAPESGRRQADVVLARALPLSTETRLGTAGAVGRGACVTVAGGSGAEGPGIPLLPGITKIEVMPGPHASLSLRRFALAEYPVRMNGVPGNSTTRLDIPGDRASRLWRLQVEARQFVKVCR